MFYGFCVHGVPTSWQGRGSRAGSGRVARSAQRGSKSLWLVPASEGQAPSQPSGVNQVQQGGSHAPVFSGEKCHPCLNSEPFQAQETSLTCAALHLYVSFRSSSLLPFSFFFLLPNSLLSELNDKQTLALWGRGLVA